MSGRIRWRLRQPGRRALALLTAAMVLAGSSLLGGSSSLLRVKGEGQQPQTLGSAALQAGAGVVLDVTDESAVLHNALVRVAFDLKKGRYSAYDQVSGKPYILGAYVKVNGASSLDGYAFTAENATADGFAGKSMRLTGTKAGSDFDMVLDITLRDKTGEIELACGLINRTAASLQLKEMQPLTADAQHSSGVFVGPNPAKNHAVLTGEGNWGTPDVSSNVSVTSKNNLLISYRNKPDMESLVLGGLTCYEFQSEVITKYNEATSLVNSDRRSIDALIRVFDYTGKRVDAGKLAMGDAALVNFTQKNPYTALEEYAELQAGAMKVDLGTTDPYLYQSLWYVEGYAFNEKANTADFALEEAKRAKARGLTNYVPLNIRLEPDTYTDPNEQLWWDDAHWKSFGHLTDTFPTIKSWSDALKSLGVTTALYMQPTFRNSDYASQYPGHMIGNNAKETADYTDPDFLAHMAEVYRNIKNADIKLMMYDYTNMNKAAGGDTIKRTGGFADPYATAVSAYRNMFAIAKQGVGKDFRVMENAWTWAGEDVAIGVIDFQRTGTDTVRLTPNIARNGLYQWYRNRTTKILYPDVQIFEEEDLDLRRAQITGAGVMFGNLSLGESLLQISDSKLHDITRVTPMPIDGASPRPVGLFEHEDDMPEVYDYKYAGDNGDHLLLLWNYQDDDKDMTVKLGEDSAFGGIGLDPDKTYEIWDFWDWRYVGRFQGSDTLVQRVRRNEMKTLAVREVKDTPYLLSTDRHVLQGTLDAHDVTVQGNTVTGAFDVVAGDPYKAVIALGNNRLKVKSLRTDPQIKADYVLDTFHNVVEITLQSDKNVTASVTLTLEEREAGTDTQAPGAPSALLTAADEHGNVTLSWQPAFDDSGYVEYEIFRGSTSDFAPSAVNKLTQTGHLSYLDREVPAGVQYYKVRALDAAGNAGKIMCVKAEVLTATIPVSKLTATAGSYEVSGHYDGPEQVLDGDPKTLWHTAWGGSAQKDRWINLHLSEPMEVSQLQYLPRQDLDNGVITSYEVQISSDGGKTFRSVAEGVWEITADWKTADFSAEKVTDVRLYAKASKNGFASAAEIRLYNEPVLNGLSLSDTAVTIYPGQPYHLAANLYPSIFTGSDVVWSSSDEAVAKVVPGEDPARAVVTGVAVGKAEITVKTADGAFSGVCTVTVTNGGSDVPPPEEPSKPGGEESSGSSAATGETGTAAAALPLAGTAALLLTAAKKRKTPLR